MRRSALLLLMLSTITLSGCSTSLPGRCEDEVAASEATVHTTHRLTASRLPGIGDYPSVHWQTKALGNPCSRVPGPTDWRYQDVIELHAADAATLASSWTWQPDPPAGAAPTEGPEPLARSAELWPDLATYVPTTVHWRHSREYDKATTSSQWHTVYFDPELPLLLVFSFDH